MDKQMKDMQKGMKEMQTTLQKAIENALKAIADSTKTLEDKISASSQAVQDKVNELSKQMESNTEGIRSIQESITELKSKVEKNEQKIANGDEKITKIQNDVTELQEVLNDDQYAMHKLVRTMEQKQLSNSIMLKGFPRADFDIEEIKQNLSSICNFDHGYDDAYKFSFPAGTDKKTGRPRNVHMMSLTLNSLTDKSKLFEKLKTSGILTLGEIMTSCDENEKRMPVWIDHRLTAENLNIKRRLIELKKNNAIKSFTLRSGNFLVQFDDQRKNFTVFEMWQLDQAFGVDQQSTNGKERTKRRAEDNIDREISQTKKQNTARSHK